MAPLDNLRKAAKRWLTALRDNDVEAQARLRRVSPDAASDPGLRVVQHALARERGFESWNALSRALTAAPLHRYAMVAEDVLSVFLSGEEAALQRLQHWYGRTFSVEELRVGVRKRLEQTQLSGSLPPGFGRAHACLLVAQEAGFDSWTALESALTNPGPAAPAQSTGSETPTPLDRTSRMIQPVEIRANLPVRLHDGATVRTTDVWHMLTACLDRARGRSQYGRSGVGNAARMGPEERARRR